MPDYWNETLLDATLEAADIEVTFPIATRDVRAGRAFARRRYPYRPGQDAEDTGQNPRVINYDIPLFRDVEEEHYPDGFLSMLDLFESDEVKGRATLTDPEFGPIEVRLVEMQWRTDARERDGGQLRVSFETLGESVQTFFDPVEGDSAGDQASAEEAAGKLDQALGDAGLEPKEVAGLLLDAGVPLVETELLAFGLSASFSANVGLLDTLGVVIDAQQPVQVENARSVDASTGFAPEVIDDDDVSLFVLLADAFSDAVGSGTLIGSDEIGAALDTFRARCGAVRGATELLTDPELQWPVLESSARLITAATRIAQQAVRDGPLVVDLTLNGEQSAIEVAASQLGDPYRVQEVLDLNPTVSPDFLPAGRVVTVPME
jgi:hypothetical protein